MLESHRSFGHSNLPVVERTDQGVDFGSQNGTRQLLGETPQLTTPCDRWVVIQVHRMHIRAVLAAKTHRDHLARFGVVTEARRIGHANELVLHERILDFQRLRHDRTQRIKVGTVGDDKELAVDEAIGAGREGRARKRHGKRIGFDVSYFHKKLQWVGRDRFERAGMIFAESGYRIARQLLRHSGDIVHCTKPATGRVIQQRTFTSCAWTWRWRMVASPSRYWSSGSGRGPADPVS